MVTPPAARSIFWWRVFHLRVFHAAHAAHALYDLAENDVLAVEVGSLRGGDEELGAVCARPCGCRTPVSLMGLYKGCERVISCYPSWPWRGGPGLCACG